MSIQIKTKRLLLREFTAEDAVELQSICSQPYILKWMPDWGRTIAERREWIRWVRESYSKASADNARVMLAVTLKSDRRLIGMAGIGNKKEVNNEIEIAYFISEEFNRKGYMSEAAKALTEWVFTNLQLDYLMAIVDPDNIPSQRVLEKCGFARLDTKMLVNDGDTVEKPFFYYRLYGNTTGLSQNES